MENQNKVSCIIAAYNEGARIGQVLSVVSGHPMIGEVIVVNDGSTDNTGKVVENYTNVRLISLSPNKGKTFAVMTGLLEAKNEIVMLLDADLVGLHAEDITNLINPVVTGIADISMTTRQNSLQIYKMLGIDFVSGERVFYKKIISNLQTLATLPRYGLEVFLNNIIIKNKLRLKIVLWNTVTVAKKTEKVGWLKGNLGEIKMMGQIIKTIPLSSVLSQIKHMKALRVK